MKTSISETFMVNSDILIFFTGLISIIICLVWLGKTLVKWAKKRKAGAVVFGAAVQMLLPDPYAERTIQVVQEQKKENIRQQKNGDPKDKNEQQDH